MSVGVLQTSWPGPCPKEASGATTHTTTKVSLPWGVCSIIVNTWVAVVCVEVGFQDSLLFRTATAMPTHIHTLCSVSSINQKQGCGSTRGGSSSSTRGNTAGDARHTRTGWCLGVFVCPEPEAHSHVFAVVIHKRSQFVLLCHMRLALPPTHCLGHLSPLLVLLCALCVTITLPALTPTAHGGLHPCV